MTLTIQTNRPVGIGLPEGGTVFWDDSEIPNSFGRTPTGALFGPLELGIPSSAELHVEDLSFLPDEDGGLFAIGAVAPMAAASDETVTLGRRGILTLLASIAGAAALANTASADDNDLVTLSVARFNVEAVDAPFSVRILDLVEEVLPQTTEILVDQDETRVGKIADADEQVTLRPETGEVRVYIRDSIGRLERLLAWARSMMPGDSSLTFRREFPDGKQASDYSDDEYVLLTEHPVIVDSVSESGPDRTTFDIGDTRTPHVDDGTDEAGGWDIVGDGLVYEVGENPPAETEWELTTQLSLVQSLRS